MTKDEALKEALDALKHVEDVYCVTYEEAITAIKEALAQTEQEPVGRFAKFTDGVWRPVTDYSAGVPLYTHPPQRTEQEPQIAFNAEVVGYVASQRTWVGLTPEEILDMFDAENVYGSKWLEFARAVEAKLKEKNT